MLSKYQQLIHRWSGLSLALIAAVSTVWLASRGQLNLYIHPRYIIFSVALATLLLLGIVIAIWLRTKVEVGKLHKLHTSWLAILCIGSFMAILVLPATTLTTASVSQRGMNSSGTTSASSSLESDSLFGNDNYQHFSIRDWSALLSETKDASFFAGKKVDITGFISPDTHKPNDIFYVSRFVISCCAVDAQPIGVPVYMPGWKEKYVENNWVHVKGEFVTQQYYLSETPAVVKPSTINIIEQPENPYVY